MKAAVALALMGLLVVAAAAMAEGRSHHSHTKTSAPAPAPGVSNEACMSAVMTDMISCMDYVVDGATEASPDKACCGGTQKVLTLVGASCLCTALASAPSFGVEVNVTRAAALPGLCHISHPPSLAKCLGAAEAKAPAVSASAPKAASQLGNHVSAPAPAPSGSSVASVSYGLMALVALLSMVVISV